MLVQKLVRMLHNKNMCFEKGVHCPIIELANKFKVLRINTGLTAGVVYDIHN